MATAVVKTDAEILGEYDAEMARIRRTIDPAERADWDREAAVSRAEVLEEFERIDAGGDDDDDDEATFSAEALPFDVARFCGADGDCVVHRGVIFRAGDYSESHGFTMSRAELAAVARDFRPVPLTHGHPVNHGPLSDDFGEVRSVELSPSGDELIGTVAVRKWLHEKLKGVRRFVSASFDRGTKRLHDVSLVTNPAIPGAELMAAFAEATKAATVAKDVVIYRVGDESTPVYREAAREAVGMTVTKAELARTIGRAVLPMPVEGGPGASGAVLTKLVLSAGGSTLLGTLEMPPAVAEALARMKLTTRAVFDRDTRILVGLQMVEARRPTEAIDSPAAFSRNERIAMSTETDEQYAARVCAKYNGRNRIADGAREQDDAYYARRGGGSATPPPAAFSAGVDEETETDQQYAKRLNDRYNGRNRPPAQESPAVSIAPMPFIPPAPVAPTDEEEGVFLARLAQTHGGTTAAATMIRATAAALPARAASLIRTFGEGWLGHVRHLGEQGARLDASARALDSASSSSSVAYTPPTAAEADAAMRRLIALAALETRMAPAKLMAEAGAAGFSIAAFETRVEGERAAYLRPSGSLAGDVEAIRDRFHRAMAPMAGHGPLRAALLDIRVLLPRALATAVAGAVEGAGGRASLAADLADIHLIEAAEPDDDEGALAEVKAQLAAVGSATTGRTAQGLRARHDELTGAIERRRSAARAKADAQAERDLSAVMAGDADAFGALVALVKARPEGFAEGLAAALAGVPTRALAEVANAPMP